jgi:putative transposase
MKSIKVRLELNNQQATLARKHAGAARLAYNWGLAKSQEMIEKGAKRPSGIDLHKLWVAEVKPTNEWTYEVSKCSPQQAFRNLDEAYKRVFKVTGVKSPKFKKRGKQDSFYLEGAIKIDGNKIKLPKFGWLKCAEILPNCEVKNVVVSRHAEHWFVSFKVEHFPPVTEKQWEKIGVDLGIKTLATMSDGNEAPAVRAYRKYLRKLRRAQRQVSKKFVKGAKKQSNNYYKAKKKVAKIHYQIACLRRDALHKLTSSLAKNHSEIVIEDLNIKGMSQNHKLASAILDGGFYEFRRQLEYKASWYGAKVTLANRFYPSSKMCSSCGNIKEKLSLAERIYKCEVCGLELNRDLNAAINLENYEINSPVSYTGSLEKEAKACRVSNQPKAQRLRDTVKQEVNSESENVQICVGLT